MDFLTTIKDRNELLGILNTAIDRIYKKESSKKYSKFASELDYIAHIYTQYCSNQLTKLELLEYFPVDDSLKDCVFKAIEIRKPRICQHLVSVHNSFPTPLMQSFDWDLKFIIGNSSLAAFREQRATLILNCQRGKETETVSVEFNRGMLNKLIEELEAHKP